MSKEMRNLIDNFNRLIVENTSEIEETGYTKIARILRGTRPSIKKLAILSAENPHGKKQSEEKNKIATEKLQKFLDEGSYGYKKIKGHYEYPETSFIIFNISMDSTIEIGAKYDQDTVIYGEVKNVDDENNTYMEFKIIGSDKTKPDEYQQVLKTTSVFVNRDNAEDLYSQIGDKKFVLPFYDVIDRLVGKDGKPYKLEKDYTGSKWDGGKVEPTDIKIKDIEDKLNKLEERIMESSGFTAYRLRGEIRDLLKHL